MLKVTLAGCCLCGIATILGGFILLKWWKEASVRVEAEAETVAEAEVEAEAEELEVVEEEYFKKENGE